MTESSLNRKYFVENCIAIWLNPNITNETIEIIRVVINDVYVFSDSNSSIDFTTDINDEKVFFIVSMPLEVEIIEMLNELTQIYGIYLFNSTNAKEDNWPKIYRKVKGHFADITALSDRLKYDTKHYEQSILPFHVLQTESPLINNNSTLNSGGIDKKFPNQQDAIFMYSTLTKEIICMMEDDDLHENMIDFCRSQYANNPHVLKMIDEFNQNIELYSPIWWYTREGFLYKMLNKALRANDIKPLFFLHNYIRRLHRQLLELHCQLVRTEPLILYRGQQMPTVEFDNIKNNIGGLLSISNFLSTTAALNIAEIYAGHPLDDPTVSSILFQLYIDPSVNTSPYADIQRYSFFEGTEQEYLFSMGSVFRIDKVQQRDDQVWLVNL